MNARLVLLSTLVFLFYVIGCAKGKQLSMSTGTNLAINDSSFTGGSSGSNSTSIQQTVKCNPSDLIIQVGAVGGIPSRVLSGSKLKFYVRASGCTGKYRLTRSREMLTNSILGEVIQFNQAYDYEVTMSLPGIYQERLKIAALSDSGSVLAESDIISSLPFIVFSFVPFDCSVNAVNPNIELRKNYQGGFLTPIPLAQMSINFPEPGYITETSVDGVIIPQPIQLSASSQIDVGLTLPPFTDSREFEFRFRVADRADANKAFFLGECRQKVSVKVTTELPPAPTCSISISNASAKGGESITAKIQTGGVASIAKINGVSVGSGGTLALNTSINGTFTVNGAVEGPGGSTTCSASYTVSWCRNLVRNTPINCCSIAEPWKCGSHWLAVTPSGLDACSFSSSLFGAEIQPVNQERVGFMAAKPVSGSRDIAVNFFPGGSFQIDYYNYAGSHFGRCNGN